MNSNIPPPDILKLIAGASLDGGKDALINTVNQAVDAVIKSVEECEPGQPLSQEIIDSADVALKFLSACAGLGDNDFSTFAKGRALQLQTAFEQVSAASGETSTQEANQGNVEEPGEVAHVVAAEPDPEFETFQEAYLYFLAKFIRVKLTCFILPDLESPRPYILNEHFVDIFVDKAVEYLSPAMLANRRLQTVAQSFSRNDFNETKFYGEFLKPERENATHLLWRSGLIDLRDGLSIPEGASSGTVKSKDQGGGLMGKFMSKGKQPAGAVDKPDPLQEKRRRAHEFWSALESDAETYGYDGPVKSDFTLFEVVFEFEEDIIAKQQKAMGQLLAQEVEELGEGRTGATRDFLGRVMDLLPPHCGEIVGLWAYRRYPELFLPEIVKSFLAGQATTSEMRKKMLPLFTRWVADPADNS
jgi:hypothetical protein